MSSVEPSTLSSDMTRAGWPTRVTFSWLWDFAAGSASNLSRMLSTAKFDAPHTRTRRGLGFAELAEVNWRIISINVWVFPVPAEPSLFEFLRKGERHGMSPGGPWIHATSCDPNANLTAAFWLPLSVGSKKVIFPRGIFSEGAEIPSNTSTSFVLGGVNLPSSCRSIQYGTAGLR